MLALKVDSDCNKLLENVTLNLQHYYHSFVALTLPLPRLPSSTKEKGEEGWVRPPSSKKIFEFGGLDRK